MFYVRDRALKRQILFEHTNMKYVTMNQWVKLIKIRVVLDQ